MTSSPQRQALIDVGLKATQVGHVDRLNVNSTLSRAFVLKYNSGLCLKEKLA